MTLSRPTEGVSVPFADLSAHQQAELLGWIRSEQERKRLADRVFYFQLQHPDGEPADRDTYEMHQSKAVELNSERMFAYLNAQRRRAQQWADWKEKVKSAKKEAEQEFKRLKERAAEAATIDIPLPDSKQAKELLEFRRAHVAEVLPPEPKVIPPPNIPYTDAEALWIRTTSSGAGVITMPNTLRCNHD
jgi:hypothetical protein